jgi:cytosine/adenosine deaminase-related metal-dependent hydrolase
MTSLRVDWLLARPGAEPARRGAQIELDADRIAGISAAPFEGRGLIALPGLVNAHDHAKAVRSSALGAFDRPLESWTFYLGLVPGIDAWRAAATSLARSALRGAGRVMVHYTRMQGLTDPVTEARDVARAARDTGVQAGFAVAMRDRNPIAYAETALVLEHLPPEIREPVRARLALPSRSVAEQMTLVEEIAAACHAPGFNVQYGPRGVQWCSDEMLRAIAEASARNGRQVHMHLMETRYQREWADRAYPQGVVAFLRDIGFLGPRLTLAHCAWCRPDELEMIAESGAVIAVNTSSNLGLRSGIAPVAEMVKRGCRVAMGLDGLALDDDDDSLRELRLLYHLHKGWGYEETVTTAQAWQFASRHGRHSVSGLAGGGTLAQGEPADLLVLDGRALMDDRLFDEVEPLDFVLARANASHIRRVIVGGNTIVEDGKVLGVDYPALMSEMMAELRARLDSDDSWRGTVRRLDAALRPFYLQARHFGCGT